MTVNARSVQLPSVTNGANVSLGAIVFTSAEFDHGAIGVFYGVGTFGETERALTVGAGGAS